MPIEFDLSFTGPETALFRPRGQKSRVYSLGINPYSHSPECRPVPYRLQTRGVNCEIVGEREEKAKEKASVPTRERRLENRFLLTAVAGGFAVTLVQNETQRHSATLKSAGQSSTYSHSFALVCRGSNPVDSSSVVGFDRLAAESCRVISRRRSGQILGQIRKLFRNRKPAVSFLSQGQKRAGFGARKRPRWVLKRQILFFAACLAKRIVASGFIVLRSRRSNVVRESDN